MNPIREWIETILRIAREQAEYSEFDRRVQRLLFLMAIEIGLGRRLTPPERERYAHSMLTAETFLALNERHPQDPKNRVYNERLLTECVSNWQKHEPRLRRVQEQVMGSRFRAFDIPVGLWPEVRDMFEGQIRAISQAFPDQLPPNEIPRILEKLDHPLDRA